MAFHLLNICYPSELRVPQPLSGSASALCRTLRSLGDSWYFCGRQLAAIVKLHMSKTRWKLKQLVDPLCFPMSTQFLEVVIKFYIFTWTFENVWTRYVPLNCDDCFRMSRGIDWRAARDWVNQGSWHCPWSFWSQRVQKTYHSGRWQPFNSQRKQAEHQIRKIMCSVCLCSWDNLLLPVGIRSLVLSASGCQALQFTF